MRFQPWRPKTNGNQENSNWSKKSVIHTSVTKQWDLREMVTLFSKAVTCQSLESRQILTLTSYSYTLSEKQSHLREELQAWALPFPELNSTSEDTTSFTDRKQGQAPRVSEQSLSVQLKHPREAISLASTPAAAAKWLQPCPTLCDPKDGSPPGSPCPWDSPGKNTGVGCHFLLQCMKVKVKSLSCVRLLETPWTAAYQAPPSMGFSRQEYWSGVPLPSPIYPWFSFNTLSLVDVDKQADQGNLTKTAVPCRKWWAFIETHGKKAHDLHSRLKSLTQRNCPFTLRLCLIFDPKLLFISLTELGFKSPLVVHYYALVFLMHHNRRNNSNSKCHVSRLTCCSTEQVQLTTLPTCTSDSTPFPLKRQTGQNKDDRVNLEGNQ